MILGGGVKNREKRQAENKIMFCCSPIQNTIYQLHCSSFEYLFQVFGKSRFLLIKSIITI